MLFLWGINGNVVSSNIPVVALKYISKTRHPNNNCTKFGHNRSNVYWDDFWTSVHDTHDEKDSGCMYINIYV